MFGLRAIVKVRQIGKVQHACGLRVNERMAADVEIILKARETKSKF